MLKKLFFGVTVAALAVMGVVAHAADETTITGEPVDIACFLTGKAGEGHAACAKGCAEKGQPLGISSKGADGKQVLYLAMGGGGKAAKDYLASVMGKQVKVTGTVAEKDGMKVITITKVEAAAAAAAAWQPAAAGSASVQNSAPATQQ